MIDQSPLPSRQLQLFARLARWSLGLVLAFWLLVIAVWGTLHGFIVPRIDMWRAEVEHIATQALGAPVHIQGVQGETNGLFPTIHLHGLSILDSQGREALRLPKVVATISARSVLRWGLEQLYIEAPELDIRHLADGRWQIAGLDMVQSDASQSPALSWLLEQPELVIRKGKVQFTDEQRAMQTVHLHDLDLLLRNRHWSHVLRIEASPDAADGERMQLVGAFRESLLPSHQAPWKNWSGQWYAHLNLHRIPQLPWAASWKIASLEGQGQTRLWLDVKRGETIGMTTDVALARTRVRWKDSAQADLDIRKLQGRLHVQRQGEDWQVQAQRFSFAHDDGSFWPSSNWSLQAHVAASQVHNIKMQLDYGDMAMAAKVAAALPLSASIQAPFSRWMPQGHIHNLKLQWGKDGHYQAQGEVKNLALRPQPAAQGVGVPGVEGLQLRFSLDQSNGNANLHIQDGTLHFPGVFEEPSVAMHQLHAQVRWSIDKDSIKVEVPHAEFANNDAQGNMHGSWQTGETLAQRLPGRLHLQGQLAQANGARVHRYLPLQLPEVARHYVRDSVQKGISKNVEFEVHGNLQDMPFAKPGSGRLYIKAPLQEVSYKFAPPHADSTEHQWPALHNLSGDLVFDGASMSVYNAKTGFEGHPQLHMASVSAHVPDLHHPVVTVNAQGQLALKPVLEFLRQSPIASYTSHALDESQASGNARIAFDLQLPIEQLENTKLQGNVAFQQNTFQFNADAPWLHQLQGAVTFSERGFALKDVQADALGGSIRLTGGMPSLEEGVHIKAHGTATAQGLQHDSVVPLLQAISAHAQGRSTYSVEIRAANGKQAVTVASNLQGMAVSLPEPFHKPAEAAWPLTIAQSVNTDGEHTLHVHIPDLLQVVYVKSPAPSNALKGRIEVGESTSTRRAAETEQLQPGVHAQVHLNQLDADAWRLALASKETPPSRELSPQAAAYLPQHVAINVERLRIMGRDLHAIDTDFNESNGTWRGQFRAQQFAGYAQYRKPKVLGDSGHVFARLTHLRIPTAEVQRLNAVMPEESTPEFSTLPALDIEVEQLEVADKSLGQLVLQARNTQNKFRRDWVLEQFNLTTPEAQWKANGSWTSSAPGDPRRTQLGFLLEMESSGELLDRMGMPGVIHNGKGRLSGSVAWQGSPISPNWHTMDGGVHMQLQQGQFLKAEPGIAKLLSVLSLQSLARRATLDFRDVFSQGFAFDFIRGDVIVENGVARTNNLQMKGLNAAVLMEGHANLATETQDLRVVVVPEINAMTASLAATAINPIVGVSSFLAQMFLRGPLMEAATRSFHIHGTWADPIVDAIKHKTLHPGKTPHQGDTP